MNDLKEFYGPNAGYVLELYDRYLQNPSTVDAGTRAFFEHWTPAVTSDGHLNGADKTPTMPSAAPAVSTAAIAGVVSLAQALRSFGHLAAQLDPLGAPPPGDPSLEQGAYGLQENDLKTVLASTVGGPLAEGATNAFAALQALRAVYCGSIGYDFEQVRNPDERAWLREGVESGRFLPPHTPIDEQRLLQELTQVDALERFLQRTFPGKTRFSIEGVDLMVPMLNEIVAEAAQGGTQAVLVGMAHRGRLNVLAHVLNKPYETMLAEFQDPGRPARAMSESHDEGWTGDVKYHLGARRALREGDVANMTLTLAPNPSHLEYINPVVEGMARAWATRADQPGAPTFSEEQSLPILIHGDAAFPGQGVVAETLNLARLAGYTTGGTLHIIANNQIGFTTEPQEGRSTLYASDLAKGFKMPIIHVNADDAVACLAVARIAYAYRKQFRKDILIDLIGYRRYGHNEGDEPGFTQPLIYEKVAAHPTVRELWAQHMAQTGKITAQAGDAMAQAARDHLQAIYSNLTPPPKTAHDEVEPQPEPEQPLHSLTVELDTGVPMKRLIAYNDHLLQMPQGFTPHPKLERAIQRRRQAMQNPSEPSIEWAHAETLAFAAILAGGTPIRMTGQDSERGTFTQRHLVFHDAKTGARYTPLQHLPAAHASFQVHNSPLSESAALGFEFGYSVEAPDTLVVWEAQYGDFINSAQVIVDQFIASARAKWEQNPSLVLLLPHGYEGQGPEHSSARLERFLKLAAEGNMRIAYCSNAGQYFHLLRRQAALLPAEPRPLVIMTPKSLLRHPLAATSLQALSEGSFLPVIDDPRALERHEVIKRLILCTGKIYVDLETSERRKTAVETAVARVELLYPFQQAEIERIIAGYPALELVVWAQEEPRNMGAWTFMAPRLRDILAARKIPLTYVGRPRRASPAEGSAKWHSTEQARIIEDALSGPGEPE